MHISYRVFDGTVTWYGEALSSESRNIAMAAVLRPISLRFELAAYIHSIPPP
jgi:hypothetical protein